MKPGLCVSVFEQWQNITYCFIYKVTLHNHLAINTSVFPFFCKHLKQLARVAFIITLCTCFSMIHSWPRHQNSSHDLDPLRSHRTAAIKMSATTDGTPYVWNKTLCISLNLFSCLLITPFLRFVKFILPHGCLPHLETAPVSAT